MIVTFEVARMNCQLRCSIKCFLATECSYCNVRQTAKPVIALWQRISMMREQYRHPGSFPLTSPRNTVPPSRYNVPADLIEWSFVVLVNFISLLDWQESVQQPSTFCDNTKAIIHTCDLIQAPPSSVEKYLVGTSCFRTLYFV